MSLLHVSVEHMASIGVIGRLVAAFGERPDREFRRAGRQSQCNRLTRTDGWCRQHRQERCEWVSLNPLDNISPALQTSSTGPFSGWPGLPAVHCCDAGEVPASRGSPARTLHPSMPALVARGSFVILPQLVRGAVETQGHPERALTGFVASTEFVLGTGLEGGGM